jgi:heme-degrading monooxygenase HmoA
VILEAAILDVKTGEEPASEGAFTKAQAVITQIPGYFSHQLQRCMENPSRYILLVNWNTLEGHTVGFRQSPE